MSIKAFNERDLFLNQGNYYRCSWYGYRTQTCKICENIIMKQDSHRFWWIKTWFFKDLSRTKIYFYKHFYGEFHNANVPKIYHISDNLLLMRFQEISSRWNIFTFGGKIWQFYYRMFARLINIWNHASIHQRAFDKNAFKIFCVKMTEIKVFLRT